MLATTLSRHWWMTLIRGLIWIVFGIVIFTQPLISLVTLTLTFGAFVLADGVGKMVTAIRGRQGERGLVGLAAGGPLRNRRGCDDVLHSRTYRPCRALLYRHLGDCHWTPRDRRRDPTA
jgi:hypothetical protein